MKTTPLEDRVSEIVTPVAADMGLNVVCVKIVGEGGSRNVQIMAENARTRSISLDECTLLSKAVSAILDVEDPIEGAYRLEVSSPGIDRPLVKLEDFIAYAGYEARLETVQPLESGQKRFKGRISNINGEIITMETEQGLAEIPYGMIVKAKLLLTDELIKMKQQTQG